MQNNMPSYTPAMHTETARFDTPSRLPGIGATIALHLVIIAAWLLSRGGHVESDDTREAIQWVDVKLPKALPATPPEQVAAPVGRRKLEVARPVKAAPIPPEPMAAVVEEQVAGTPVEAPDTKSAKSVDDIMQQARRDIGKISTDLRKEYPVRGIRAPIDTAQKRLVKGIALAHELAPGKWYERPKMTEVTDPGGQGRRRYRVMTAAGPMCWTVDAPHTPNGRDQAKGAGPPKLTNCPPDEEPAKAQEW